MTVINPSVYQAMVVRKGLEFYVKTGMRINRAYTPAAMMLTATHITGETFARRDYKAAIAALTRWIDGAPK